MSVDADLLRRAATRLRDDASRAARSPWRCEQGSDEAPGIGPYEWWDVVDGSDHLTINLGAWPVAQGNAEWIAMLGPQLADPLAAWLEAEADLIPAVAGVSEHAPRLLDAVAEDAGVETAPWEVSISVSTTPAAVAFARALLGETEETTP